MEQYSYYREQLNILTQFAAAFDGSFVYRYTKDFQKKEKINVRYVFGPKHRILYDIVNLAKNHTLPVVALHQTNIKRDPSRIQFKDQKIIRRSFDNKKVAKIPMPIPVLMDVDVSIVANYKEDIDQIISNIIPWSNPYFTISWKVPEEFGLDFIEEIRTDVTWSGSVDFEMPVDVSKDDKYKIVGNTSFTIKGWIFPPFEAPSAPIYVVNSNFVAVATNTIFNYDDIIENLSAYDSDMISISAYPSFTNSFYAGIPILEDTINISPNQQHTLTFYGKRFGFNNSWYLSGTNVSDFQFEEIDTAKFPTISAYKIPDNLVTTVNDNIAVISLSAGQLSSGMFTIVTANSAGWARIDTDVVVI